MTMNSQVLRQSTASQIRQIGPFVSDTDFKTYQNGLTIAASDIKFRRHAGTSLVNKNSGGATSLGQHGLYHMTLDATDTQTAGILDCSVLIAGSALVTKGFVVLPANVFDSLVVGGDVLQTDLIELIGSSANAQRLRDAASSMQFFTVVSDAGNSATQVKTDLAQTDPDFWKGAQIIFLTGALAKQRSAISAYNGTTKVLTYGTLTGTPSAGDTGLIV